MIVARKNDVMVHRQYDRKNHGPKAGIAKYRARVMGVGQENLRLVVGKRYKSNIKICAREIESPSRPIIKEGRDILPMGENTSKSCKQVGTLQPGTIRNVWGNATGLRRREDNSVSSSRKGKLCDKLSGQTELKSKASRPSNSLGQDTNSNNPKLARVTVDTKIRKVGVWPNKTRETTSSRTGEMKGEKWKRLWMPSPSKNWQSLQKPNIREDLQSI